MDSIVDVFDCLHSSIGEELYKNRSKSSLAKNGIFFYDHFYYIPGKSKIYGKVEKIALPSFDSIDWPLPCQNTSEAYRFKLYAEIQKCMKPNIASTQSRVSIFMPIGVFVDFFLGSRMRITKTMIVVQNVEMDDML